MSTNMFPEKFMKKLKELPDFIDGVNSADTEELKKRILISEGHIYDIEQDKDNNTKLQDIKEQAKNISKPYSDAKSIETAKIKYYIYILEDRGIEI